MRTYLGAMAIFSVGLLVGAFLVLSRGPTLGNDCLHFVDDVTVFDGALVPASSQIAKIWRVQNCGDTTWANYKLVRKHYEVKVAGTKISRGMFLLTNQEKKYS